MPANLQVVDLLDRGHLPYLDTLRLQRDWVVRRQRDEVPDTLLLLEHAPTVTYGKAANSANLLLPPEAYADRGIALIESDRGGDVTYHGPGQLVGYPILHLGEGRRDVHRYVRGLEAAVIAACRDLGLDDVGPAPWHAGVWSGDGYLAALGVRISRWVTHHGFALNVTEEVREGFATIVPCGVAGKRIATVSELLGRRIEVRAAAAAVATTFAESIERGIRSTG